MAKSVYIGALIATVAIILVIFFMVIAAEDNKVSQFNSEISNFVLENDLYTSFTDFDQNNKDVYCALINESIVTARRKCSRGN